MGVAFPKRTVAPSTMPALPPILPEPIIPILTMSLLLLSGAIAVFVGRLSALRFTVGISRRSPSCRCLVATRIYRPRRTRRRSSVVVATSAMMASPANLMLSSERSAAASCPAPHASATTTGT